MRQWFVLAAGMLAAIAMNASGLIPVNVMGAAVLAAVVSENLSGRSRRAVLTAAIALAALGAYRLALKIGLFWTLTDRLGGLLGGLAGGISGQPLWVGATFSGLDFLVVMGVFCAGWILSERRANWSQILTVIAAIVVGHLAYLIVLSFAPAVKSALAPAAAEAAAAPGQTPAPEGWTFAGLIRNCIPWNVPAVGLLIHLTVAAVILRMAPWSGEKSESKASTVRIPGWVGMTAWGACAVLAAGLAITTTLSTGSCSLDNKKVVANEEGFLNWLRPDRDSYGRLAIGMYGMSGDYFESMGANFTKATGFSDTSKADSRFSKPTSPAPEIPDDELAKTDLLMMIYPNDPWRKGQRQRILNYVENGGTMLVLGEHTTKSKNPAGEFEFGESRVNELLENTDMHVRFDSATFAVGGWLHSYQTLGHPTTEGIDDERNRFGSVIGASVQTGWTATPLLIGRWGWADPGEFGGSAMMGNGQYDPGEKLGDMVLAAEQNYGKGRIITFGDTSSFTNGITIGSHLYTSRLFGYMAGKVSSPQAIWRQILGIIMAAGLIALLVWSRNPLQVILAGVTLSAALVFCTHATYTAATVVPDGRRKTPNNLAYIDSTHMEAFSPESWRPKGMMGLNQTLMRDGYLVLNLPEFTQKRIERAGIVVSVAPAREFSPKERDIVRNFVRDGGIFICTVGYEQRCPSSSLLADFGFRVGLKSAGPNNPDPEPQPMGHFKVPYIQSRDRKKQAYVRYYASWPIVYSGKPEDARTIAYGRQKGGADYPCIMFQRFGKGKFVVIGDSSFAMNKNLERKDGRPIEGMRENADFWRWFLTTLKNEKVWNPLTPTTAPEDQAGGRKEAAK
jgi:hypothetical protein